MSRRHFVRRVLPLGVGLFFLALPTPSSGPEPAVLCASQTVKCTFELSSTCEKDDGTVDLDYMREEDR